MRILSTLKKETKVKETWNSAHNTWFGTPTFNLFWHHLKTSENQRLSDFFRDCQKKANDVFPKFSFLDVCRSSGYTSLVGAKFIVAYKVAPSNALLHLVRFFLTELDALIEKKI